MARQYAIGACWATPILSEREGVLGSFAIYSDTPRAPSDEELQLIDGAANVARLAIERQRAQQALQHSEARNRAMLRAIPDWMFLTTIDGVFLDYHARDESRLYVPPSAFIGKNVNEVLPPAIAQMLAQAFARVRASDEPEVLEYTMGADDSERFYEANIVRCDGDKILSIVRDVTERKRAELEVSAQRTAVAHLGRVAMLGELTGTLAHELSQPMTAVLLNAQAARRLLECDRPDLAELRAALDDVIRNNKRAGAVIDRLRTLLRKEATSRQPVNVNEVVREVVDLARSEIVSRRIILKSTLAPGVPMVLGDRIQLQQVLLNLVLNACDAMSDTPPASRHLTLATTMENGTVHLMVSDRGVGIPKDRIEQVFEPFVTFREKGLGLGLTISRSIVRAHNGAIRVENNVDGGATFWCVLPMVSAEEVQQAALRAPGTAPNRPELHH
jgi:PAS domain S-box-containing protein